MNKFLHENLKTIEELIKKTIKYKILNVSCKYGSKIYIDYKNEIRELSVPNEQYETGYMEKVLCYIPPGANGFNYYSAGPLKKNLSEEEFNEFVEHFIDDEDMYDEDYDKVYQICSTLEDWRNIYYISYTVFEKALEKHVDLYLSNLKVEINDENEISFDIEYNSKKYWKGLISLKDASKIFNKEESTLRRNISNRKFKEGFDCMKFGKQWVFDIKSLEREYGKNEQT